MMVGMEKTTTDRKGRIIPTTEFEEHVQDLIKDVEELLEVAGAAGTAIIPQGRGSSGSRPPSTPHRGSRGGGGIWSASGHSSTRGVSSRVMLSGSGSGRRCPSSTNPSPGRRNESFSIGEFSPGVRVGGLF